MTIAANAPHARIVKFWNALQAHPEYLVYLEPALKERVKAQAAYVAPLLQAAETSTESDDKTAAEVEAVFEHTRTLIKQVNLGLEYQYGFKHSAQLKELIPLTLGINSREDEVHLATLIRVVPTLTPTFIWLPHDGLTHLALVKQHKAHEAAEKTEASLGATEKGALAALRAARPASKLLWSEDTGLDAWIKAHIPKDMQYAFGRERRQRPRHASSEPTTTTTAAPPAAK